MLSPAWFQLLSAGRDYSNNMKLLFSIRKKFILFIAGIALSLPAFAGNPLNTPILNNAANRAGYKTDINPENAFSEILGNIVFTLVSFVGIFFVLLIAYGGYVWMNARGSENDVEKAKRIIRDAIVGLVVLSASYSVWLLVSEWIL